MPPTFVWRITKPDGTLSFGIGPAAGVTADQVGTYTCRFTARANRECQPPMIFRTASATVASSATMTLNPSSIGATTAWTGMPAGFNKSEITVIWTPPECVGRLEIVEIEGAHDYVPPGNGTLDQESDTVWHYTGFNEPITELCPKEVTVSIAAMQGDVELTRKTVLVWPVHRWLVTGVNADFQKAYDYIRWKYAAVLATTGGTFSSVTISPSVRVPCPDYPGTVFDGPLVYACITDASVVFGTDTFGGSENQAASIIGHELMHTVGADECEAYQWEADHTFGTATTPCDTDYIRNVLQYLANRDNCP